MKAVYARRYGGLEVMEYGELPDPTPGPGDVLLTVKASSINPVDYKIRDGILKLVTGSRFPKVYGGDVAGIVEAMGPGVRNWRVGDRCYGYIPIFKRKQGAHAQKAVVAHKSLYALPGDFDFAQAATLPIAALTALNGWRLCGPIEGREVLINGASGGVGHFAVQIARAYGAKVTGVCSATNAALVTKLGAIDVIDYMTMDINALQQRFDAVFDAFGHMQYSQAKQMLRPKGAFINTLPSPAIMARSLLHKLAQKGPVIAANYRGMPEDYQELQRLIEAGDLRPHIGKRFDISDGIQAYAAIEKGGTAGKIVITMS